MNKALSLFCIFFSFVFLHCDDSALLREYPQLFNRNAPFVSVRPMGKFANHLFEAATGISLALDNNAQYIHKSTMYGEIFEKFYSPLRKRVCYRFLQDDSLPFQPVPYKRNIELKGYFQSFKYFDHNKKHIQKIFAPSSERVAYLTLKYPFLIDGTPTVGLHIRTYIVDKAEDITLQTMYTEHVHPPNLPFLETAIAYFEGDPLFVVCSDCIPWAKKALAHIDRKFIFVEDSYLNDFYLLSMCDHCIISNSTFSWWAAYLNTKPNSTIIAPVPFKFSYYPVDDILPKEWVRINRVEDGMIPNFDGGEPFIKI